MSRAHDAVYLVTHARSWRLLASFGPALAALILGGCRGDADFGDQVKVETFDADEYRAEIVAIDGLVFRETPLGVDGRRALGDGLSGLAQRVGTRSGSMFSMVESLELRLLGERAASLPTDATGASLRNEWMRVRNNLFEDREWFARSPADLETAPPGQTSAPRPVVRGD
jgi:hypothetical protein